MTPISNPEPQPNSPEAAYNRGQQRVRSLIERCNGLLKMRFRCLLKHRVLHYTPIMASKIIKACVVLHNMCIAYNVPAPEEDEELLDAGVVPHLHEGEPQRGNNPELAAGRTMRANVIRSYFT